MQELNLMEVEAVSGGVTTGQVMYIGAGVAAVGGAALAIVGGPILAPAIGVYALVAGGFALGGALSDAGFGGGFLRKNFPA